MTKTLHKSTLRRACICITLLFLSISSSYAQPANDDWANASEIIIGSAGFERGTFQSDIVDVTGATNEFGENLDNPSYPKTVWYKFTIPTKRVVRVKVLQPTEVLQSTDAGFVVYKQTSGVPGAADLAVFTPFYSFASYSENECLASGVYYVQAVAKNGANSDIYVELDIDHTYPIAHPEADDKIENKHDFGILGSSVGEYVNWSCVSMDSEQERAHITGPDSLEYNKSFWSKFTTDNHIDITKFRFNAVSDGIVYMQLWEGDIDSADVGNLAPIYQDSLMIDSYYYTFLPCLLDSNTTYTMQLVVKESVTGTFLVTLNHIGEGQVTGAYPQEAAFHPNNQFGMISPLPDPGITLNSQDYFSCLANLENDSIVCGTANSADTAFVGTDHFELTTWFTFGTDAESNLVLTASLYRELTNIGSAHSMGYRIFNQHIDNECTSYDYPADLYQEGIFAGNGILQLKCLPPGEYAIQLLGRTVPIPQNAYWSFQGTHLGSRIDLTVNCSSVPLLEYGLDAPGEVDWINGGAPLQEGIEYFADSAYFSCTKTVLPDTTMCEPQVDRGIYRQLNIGDADGDAQPDSGMLIIYGLAAFDASLNQAANSPFYKGDADALATAQSAYAWPSTIDGLDPYDGCNMYNDNDNYYISGVGYYSADHAYKKYCITPGTYTLAQVGDSAENGLLVRPAFKFEKTVSQFSNPSAPEDIGDIIAQGLSVTSQTDYFSCLDNPDTIAGLGPCAGYTKQLYREFYISQACELSVNYFSDSSPYGNMRLFSGRVSDVGIDGLTLAPFHSSNCYSGHYSADFNTPPCSSVPEGWYTVVSYGFGPNYENNYEFHEEHVFSGFASDPNYGLYNINNSDYVTISVDTAITPGPFYNEPYKACAHPDTIKYINTGTVDIPTAGSSYTFCQEYFSAQTDTPFVDIPIVGCPDAVRLAYYVFTTDDEYYAVIGGISNFYSELYELDVREDSLLFPSTAPLVTCETSPAAITVCRLQPGTYTLVVYGTASQQCLHFQPDIYVSPVDVSRFDFAANAYDFGLIPPDNTAYGGAVGDVHPTNTNLLPSNDFFYCTTGAFSSDVGANCDFNGYGFVYPDTINNVYFNDPTISNTSQRRNLWYTFVLQGTGDATVQVRNLTNGYTPAFAVYESDVDGTLPFSSLVGTADLDSTSAQGLTHIVSNSGTTYCWQNKPETKDFQYYNDPCIVDSTYRRYYVIVEAKSGVPNQAQVDVQVTWDPIYANPQDPIYDFYHEANVLGAGEIAPPYSNTPLDTETLYFGGWGNLSCATSDTTDADLIGCSNMKSLWYKIILNQRGYLYIGRESDSAPQNAYLLKQVNAPDSIVSTLGENGIANYGMGTYANLSAIYANANWRVSCVDSGTYYVNVATCNPLDTSEVRILAYFEEISGNNCSNAPFVEAPGLGLYSLSDNIGCHSIGDDFGEDGSDMGCLLGPDGFESSWFKFSYTGSELVDILFKLNLSSLSNYGGPDQVRYRLFYGDDCASMIEGAECSVNAYINNSVACVSDAEGDFYVQVTYPNSSSGVLGFTFTVSENTNPDCNPFNPSILTSDFVYQMNCDGDSLIFTNYSTSGSNLTYFWDFGDGNTSTEVNPMHAYAPVGTYPVTLGVVNPATQDTVFSTQDIDFQIGASPLELGLDQLVCLGESATLGGFISQASYAWSTGEMTPEIDVVNAGQYYLDLTLNGCLYSDTVSVDVIDLSLDLGPDVEMCMDDTLVLAYTGSADPAYNWSTGGTDSSAVITATGDYWLELSQGGCVRADTIGVLVHDLSFDLGNDTTICEGTSYYLTPSTPVGVGFDWSTGASIDSILVMGADSISLEINLAGCTFTSEMVVSVLDLELELGADTTICIGETLTLSPETNTTVSYLWDDNSTNPTLDVSTPGWYAVDVEALSCIARDSIEVSVLDLNFELPEDTTICLGANLLIDPQLSAGLNYNWNTGESVQTITVDTAGVFELTVDSIGCTTQSDIEVSILDLTFTLGPDSVICDGETISLSSNTTNGDDYLWSDGTTNQTLMVDTTGLYSLDISKDGCLASDAVQVTVFYVDAQLASSLTACLHDTTHLAVSGADSLQWNSGQSDISVIDDLNFWFHPDVDGTYNWTAYENGCAQTGSFDFVVTQPYIPTPVFDDTYCLNENEITMPVIDYTSGVFTLAGAPISTIDIATQGTSDFEVLYTYTDTNTCAYQISLDYSIVDTTTISIDPIDPLCIDATALNLAPYLSDGMGETSVQYDLTNWTVNPAFHTDSLQQNVASPLTVPIRYTYVNGQNCQSVIDGEVIVHPLPVPSYTVPPICAEDTAVFVNNTTVSGSSINSEMWTFENNGTFNGNIPTEVSYADAGLYEIALEVTSDIGCSAAFIDSLEVYALPVMLIDPYGPFCLNNGDIGLPVHSPIGGDFTYNGSSIGNFDTEILGAGTHAYTFSFTDGNGCFNNTTDVIVVNDTTTVSIDPIDPICIDAVALNLAPYLSDGMGETSVQYDLTNWTVDPAFHTDSLQQNVASPLTVPIRYTYVNGQNCQSVIGGEVIVHPMPIPSFTASPICAEDTAVFVNNTTVSGSSIDSEMWTFENNGAFNGNIPTEVSYANAGLYEIALEVTSDIGCSATFIDSLEVYALPILIIDSYGPFCLNDGDIALPVHTPVDGIFTHEGTVLGNFDTELLGAGTHAYIFSYINANGCFSEMNGNITVNDTTTTSISLIDPICIDANPFDLLPSLSDGLGTVSIQYNLADWIDQSIFQTDSVQQDITNPISVPIQYSYVNADNCTSLVESTVDVHPMPIADFDIAPTCVGEEVVFTNYSSVNGSGIANEEWTFEGNGTFTGNNPIGIVYDVAGIYEVTLTITSDIGCVSTHIETLEIMALPDMAVDAFGPFCHNDGFVGVPNATPIGGTFSWNGGFTTNFNTYDMETGTHNFVYAYTDMNGCFNDISGSIVVNDTTTIYYTAPFDPLCIDGAPFDLTAYKSHANGETFVQYNLIDWTPDDEFQTSEVAQNITNPLAVPVLFTYTNDLNCTSNLTSAVNVHPLPVINVSVPDICANEALVVTNNSYVNGSAIGSINWDIEEQGTYDTYALSPMYFDEPDTLSYAIDITSDIGCYSAFSSTFKIYTVPESSFSWQGVCDNIPVEFASSSTIDSGSLTGYNWLIDGTSNLGSSDSYTHLFPAYGEHQVGLIAISDQGCMDTVFHNLYINPSPVGGMVLANHCLEEVNLIQPNPTIPEGQIVQINWISNEEFSVSSMESFEHVFSNHGLHTIHQIVTSTEGCQTVYSDDLRVYPLPEMAFDVLDEAVCEGGEARLFNTSTIAQPSEIVTTKWSINHLTDFEGDTITWIVNNPGYAVVELTGISDFGCVGTLTDSEALTILPKPEGYFVFNENPLSISNPTVQITDLSSAHVVDWEYDMGDGFDYSLPNPKHTYDEAGDFQVVQTIMNEFGCRDTTSRIIRVEGFIVYVPNAFSPNGDGINDIFKPSVYGEEVARYVFRIWNRHGEMIFESTEVPHGWNGTSANSEYFTENTIYTYYVMVQGEFGKTHESRGSVMMVR